jgi:hypothetical protein
MSTSPSTLTDLTSFLSTASSGAAAWYNGITGGTPVITSASQAAANQLAINQASQLALAQSNPTLSGILANPTIIIIIGLALLALIFYVMK